MRIAIRGSALRCVIEMGAAMSLAGAMAPVQGADPAQGARKAVACQACHGPEGLSRLPVAPHLAGQPREYFVKALKAYRSGERRDEMMALIARPLSDQDIDDLADYYASIEIGVKPPAVR